MIRKAQAKDTAKILELLTQVNLVHHDIRPDIFKGSATKYSEGELQAIFADEKTPVFVFTDEADTVQGYAFCIFYEWDNALLQKRKSVYIDDLCVDEKCRGKRIGTALYTYVPIKLENAKIRLNSGF